MAQPTTAQPTIGMWAVIGAAFNGVFVLITAITRGATILDNVASVAEDHSAIFKAEAQKNLAARKQELDFEYQELLVELESKATK